MSYQKELIENFTFMALETIRQVEDALVIVGSPNEALMAKIISRDDYIDILKNVIENKCFIHINQLHELDEHEISRVRFLGVISNNLEHIADYAANIVGQCRYFSDVFFMQRYDYGSFFAKILEAMDLIVESMEQSDISMALRLCKSEREIDILYEEVFHQILTELKAGGHTENLLTALFIFRYLERMGDELLNIGEAIISSVVGEKLKIQSYQALEETLDAVDLFEESVPFTYRQIAETQSGCNVALVERQDEGASARGVIFKEGRAEKILAEKGKIEMWNERNPGMTPRVFGMQQNGENASIIIEYIGGSNFQEILLGGDDELVDTALASILLAVQESWQRTKVMEPAQARYLDQMADRIADVFRVHPDFDRGSVCIGKVKIRSFRDYITDMRLIEANLAAPFSVLIHGDFNNDNVIYDPSRDKVFFVDIYRSTYSDYVQDASVFLVSNFRLPVFDGVIRRRIDRVIIESLRTFRGYAADNDDRQFDVRMALGLARAFITSTRFELNREFSRSMYQRAWYLMEKVRDFGVGDEGGFKLPSEVLIY